MCNYCGCRDFPLIGRLSAEHVEIGEVARTLRMAVDRAAYAEARDLLDDLLALLLPHTAEEERGLFAELREEGTLTGEVDRLCGEHAEIHGVLAAVDRADPDWDRVLGAVKRLHEHIDKEEHGLFPASVIVLPIPAWDRITA
ncbi:hemerythrin domain-containing protein [Nonomuraea sp. C10]|uniref:hemerythrin domain-containing protein n=1 Tax=Nonomuraea sp. C10 TaxID=2600577 RepID=UPI0011CDF517|nr:hemerythrin domain-containing protein [Nonomuraea sp. C10]TXK34356.1 hemerythrin domain-containing protein [Nonomuraea sp. C10]